MRSRPIGTKNTLTPSADRSATRQRVGNKPVDGPADIYPVDVRYNGGDRPGGSLWRWSRLIITADALYIARSNDRGLHVTSVSKYPLPAGGRTQVQAKKGSWGPFSWSGCGCANSWGRHTKGELIALGDGQTTDA
jgi:hypothetical protein